MKNRKSFILYFNDKFCFEFLDGDECKALILAVFDYASERKLPDFSEKTLKIAFANIQSHLDNDDEKYREISEKRRSAAARKWNSS